MQQWEYTVVEKFIPDKVIYVNNKAVEHNTLSETLNALGKNGWEALNICFSEGWFHVLLKRPL
jgi:hypothetical protein